MGLLGAATSFVLLQACTKEENVDLPHHETTKVSDPTPRVKAFIARAHLVDQGVQKDRVVFSRDSAAWYIEAGLNFSTTQAYHEYTDLDVQSFTLDLSTTDDGFSPSAVYDAFNMAHAVLAPLTTEEQHVRLVDVVAPTSGSDPWQVSYQVGSGYAKAAPNNNYNSQQDYNYGWLGTQPTAQCVCGNNPNLTSYCAEKTIQQRINQANTYGLQPGQYFTAVETWKVNRRTLTDLAIKEYSFLDPVMVGPNPPGSGYRETRTFYWKSNSVLGGSSCLQDNEMAFWTGTASQGTWSAITTIKGLHCPTKLFLSCVGSPHGTAPLGAGYYTIMHEWVFTYGLIGGGGNG